MTKKRINKIQIWIIAIIAVVFLELLFDVFEIVMGKYMLVINSARPQIGRLWEQEQKDVLAEEEVAMVETLTPDSIYSHVIPDYFELLRVLDEQNKATLNRASFLGFYKRIGSKVANQIIDPLDLYDLDRRGDWRTVSIRKVSGQIAFSFMDGFNQPIKETYLVKGKNINVEKNPSRLEDEAAFTRRIISAEDFYTAFDQLSHLYRLQILNDPYRLFQWKDSLYRVGISKYAHAGSVELAFELDNGSGTIIYKVTSGELAVGYLVSAINKKSGKTISLPQHLVEEND